MELIDPNTFLDLEKYKKYETVEKIVFHLPIGMHVDLSGENREYLLKIFKEVTVTIEYHDPDNQIVECFKKP